MPLAKRLSGYETRVLWYGRRFRAMSAREVAARLGRTFAHRSDDLMWRFPRAWKGIWSNTEALTSGVAPAHPIGFLTHDRGMLFRERWPDEADAIVEAAEDIVAGRVRFFGYSEVHLANPVDFAYDPHADVRWPARHGKRIDYRHVGRGDPKWIWELNRCQHLPLLIQAWLVSERVSFAEAAVHQALAWRAQNPPGRGIAWANGYEAGLRAISLSNTFDALRGSGLLTHSEESALVEVLWQHGQWIRRDPSTHSSANNHRIGELVGMVSLCVLVPEMRVAESWLEAATAELALQASRQILPDGLGAEMAFAYHLHAVDLLLVAVAMLDAANRTVPAAVLDAIDRSGDAIWAQVGRDDLPLRYGDSDDAVAIRLGSSAARDARGVAASIASRLPHPRARLAARELDSYSRWLFGDAGIARFASTAPAPAPQSTYLTDGGLVLLRNGRTRVSVDVGPLGFLSLAAHGHSDALAVTLAGPNGEVVTDPGVGSYFREPEVREAFRSTAVHATVEVDDCSQSEPGGAFLWSIHAHVVSRTVDLAKGLVMGEHDGYRRLSDPVRHRRAVLLLDSGELLVCDLLNAAGSHVYRQQWPLAKDLGAQVVREMGAVYHGAALISRLHERVCLRVAATAPGQLILARGERRPMRGWWSERLESLEPAWLCSWLVEATGDVALAAVISRRTDAAIGPLRVALDGSSVLVAVGGGSHEVVYRVDFDEQTALRTDEHTAA